jgi:phenylalanyl-tRNA synthetase beta chain
MPTVAVDKEELWERLGHRYCAWFADLFSLTVIDHSSAASEDFDNLLFEFGLELDEDVRGSLGQRLIP